MARHRLAGAAAVFRRPGNRRDGEGLDRFIADPKTLTLRVKGKDAPLKVGEFVHIADPIALINRLDVTGSPAADKPAPGVKP